MIAEFKVKLMLPDTLKPSDVTYVIDRSVPGVVSARFTTRSLLAAASGCTAQEGAIGIIGQTAADPKRPIEHKVGSDYYAFYSPQGSCAAGTLEQTQTAAPIRSTAALPMARSMRKSSSPAAAGAAGQVGAVRAMGSSDDAE